MYPASGRCKPHMFYELRFYVKWFSNIVLPSAGLLVLWIRIFVNSFLDMAMDLTLLKTQRKPFCTSFTCSYLPEEVLVAWERSRNHSLTETKESRTLEQLMRFLLREVKGEEMINLARTGFAFHQTSRQKELHNDQVKQSESTTASALVSLQTPVLSEKIICGFIPRIENKEILNELKRKKIDFTDSSRNETEIELLIGADILGKLLAGNIVELESGLTAVETKLGWTVFGKGSCKKDNILTTLSMYSMNVPINKLWQLEVLGVSSPTETEKEKGDLDLNDFNNKIKILPDGRYEVELPWKYDSKNLPNNKELVWERHERMINRFGKGEFFSDYQKVFQDWEKLNIIERVPDFELNRECHYLSHRPVNKLDSQTTKICPVFDASASQRGSPSLNECLFNPFGTGDAYLVRLEFSPTDGRCTFGTLGVFAHGRLMHICILS
ncbi:hypothetical protein AVEN_84680-1 [Araneus ventricosus]|uniref:Peptidase aspartic putative domain-containing protein n=1 Tax=Araneus ventricosus TaxID=182803 RepID=A0A4Y2SH94_ARAVE|nr:hypothetical protein AVEN_84680-1 [Araneus ventricosus]